jgi:uncharacterized protein (TIGR02453 family)
MTLLEQARIATIDRLAKRSLPATVIAFAYEYRSMGTNIVFAGFSSEAMTFFRGLERNNRREWFQPRKEIYESSVRAPMMQLVEAVNLALSRFAPDHVTDPAKAVFRIYRDTRFSPDKTPYKTHIAATFWRRGHEKHGWAGYYFSVSHKEVAVGGGIYRPGPEQLLAVRQHLAEHHGEFRKLAANRKLVSIMGPLQGESLARVPKGFACDHPAADLIRMKYWLYYKTLDPAIATKPELFDMVVDGFHAIQPVVDFLNQPLARRKTKIAAADLL